MAFADLQSFVTELERSGQLKRIAAPVDSLLEISAIADRAMKAPCPEGLAGAPSTDPVHGGRGGLALLFENVAGSRIPVLINAYGSYARVKLALGCDDLETLAERVQQLIKPEVPTSLEIRVNPRDAISLPARSANAGRASAKTNITPETTAFVRMMLSFFPRPPGRKHTDRGIESLT